MTQRTLDPRMLDSSQALPAMSGANLTGVDASDLVFISKNVISSATSALVVNFDQTAYSNWLIWIRDLHSAATANIGMRWSNDNGTTFTNQNYGYYHGGGRNGHTFSRGASFDAYAYLGESNWDNSGSKFNATINFTTKAGDNQDEVCYWWMGAYNTTAGSAYQSHTNGSYHVVAPNYNTAFEITAGNGGTNLDEGTVTLYGYKET